MYSQFVKEKVNDVLQFKFDGRRPDLTKLDSILGSLCSKDSKSFSGFVEILESNLKSKSLTETLENLKLVSSIQSMVSIDESVDNVF